MTGFATFPADIIGWFKKYGVVKTDANLLFGSGWNMMLLGLMGQIGPAQRCVRACVAKTEKALRGEPSGFTSPASKRALGSAP